MGLFNWVNIEMISEENKVKRVNFILIINFI